jgi:hypothetical protein
VRARGNDPSPPDRSTVKVTFVEQFVSALSGYDRSVGTVTLHDELRGAPDVGIELDLPRQSHGSLRATGRLTLAVALLPLLHQGDLLLLRPDDILREPP